MAQFSQRLMKIRSSRGWTQAQLAQVLGISTYALHRYETDQKMPTHEELELFAEKLKVTKEWLSGQSVPRKLRNASRPAVTLSVDTPAAESLDDNVAAVGDSPIISNAPPKYIRCPGCWKSFELLEIHCPHCGSLMWNLSPECPSCGLDPAVSYSTFGEWPTEIHAAPEQVKKIEKAVLKDCAPLRVSKKAQRGVFVGRTGSDYKTTLSSCTCVSFSRDRVPCKHMYRLAMELDLFPKDFRSGLITG